MTLRFALGLAGAWWRRRFGEAIVLRSELSTAFHRDLASWLWRQRLLAHVEAAVRAHPEFQRVDGSAALRSEHDQERFMGASSAVRLHFVVDVWLLRRDAPGECDRCTIWVRYLPATGSFKTRREIVETLEMRIREAREEDATAFEELRAALNDREAIYFDKGALRVRVSAIALDVERRAVTATIEEIPTPGFRQTLIHERLPSRTPPLTWGIAGGYLTAFTAHQWTMGYGGWHLDFEPSLVAAVVELAAHWPEDLSPLDRYRSALDLTLTLSEGGPMKRVFRDRRGQTGLLGSS